MQGGGRQHDLIPITGRSTQPGRAASDEPEHPKPTTNRSIHVCDRIQYPACIAGRSHGLQHPGPSSWSQSAAVVSVREDPPAPGEAPHSHSHLPSMRGTVRSHRPLAVSLRLHLRDAHEHLQTVQKLRTELRLHILPPVRSEPGYLMFTSDECETSSLQTMDDGRWSVVRRSQEGSSSTAKT